MYYVYIATNKNNTVLYIGMSNNLERRMLEHGSKETLRSAQGDVKSHSEGVARRIPFTAKYNIGKLIYYDTFSNPNDAIAAEKKIKGWTRKKKVDLIESINSEWNDLFEA